MFFEAVFPTKTFNIINSLLKGQAMSMMQFVRAAANVLAYPLATLFNFAFTLGLFPAVLKIAKITLMYKNRVKAELSSYRPISVLTTFF